MKIKEIVESLNAKLVCGEDLLETEIKYCFASDLMSDVLTLENTNILLITGLANIQTIRTAEMADILAILFVRKKKASKEMLELAAENNLVLMETAYSMFRSSGILYQKGLNPVF
jgi:predicted transcriptional regulator